MKPKLIVERKWQTSGVPRNPGTTVRISCRHASDPTVSAELGLDEEIATQSTEKVGNLSYIVSESWIDRRDSEYNIQHQTIGVCVPFTYLLFVCRSSQNIISSKVLTKCVTIIVVLLFFEKVYPDFKRGKLPQKVRNVQNVCGQNYEPDSLIS